MKLSIGPTNTTPITHKGRSFETWPLLDTACPSCGATLRLDPFILDSYPPTYTVECADGHRFYATRVCECESYSAEKCGDHDFAWCSWCNGAFPVIEAHTLPAGGKREN